MRETFSRKKFLSSGIGKWAGALLAVLLLAGNARADSTSYVGTLTSSESVFGVTLTLTSTESVTLQTYGFGGGTNAAGATILAGGTDPFLAIFAGSGQWRHDSYGQFRRSLRYLARLEQLRELRGMPAGRNGEFWRSCLWRHHDIARVAGCWNVHDCAERRLL